MRLLTINLLHGGFLPGLREDRRRTAARMALLARALAELAPDVVAVQEALVARAGSVADGLAARLGFAMRFAAANPSIVPPPVSQRIPAALRARIDGVIRAALDFQEGVAILTRLPIREHAVHALPRPRFALENRIALRCRVVTASGDVDVWSAHLTRAGGGHGRQTGALARLVLRESRAVPAFVLGDFNVEAGAPALRPFDDAGFVDAARAAPPDGPALTAWQRVDAPGATVSRRVDFCWLAPEKPPPIVSRCRIVLDRPGVDADGRPLWPSDHYGVLVEVAA
jgi:endonuclease/exonuclease/phosphatase family metal-dependent hydrolase